MFAVSQLKRSRKSVLSRSPNFPLVRLWQECSLSESTLEDA